MFQVFKIFLKLIFSKKTKRILVIFQNNHELRGGGGFITQLLDVGIGRGKLTMDFRHDHQDLQPKVHIDPPDVVKHYLKLNHWFFRDTNLLGDFAENAENMRENYGTIYKNHEVAGVIAVNFSLIEKILKIVGSIKINNMNLTEKNLFFELTNAISDFDRHDLKELNARKTLLKQLFSKLRSKLISHFWHWSALAKLLNKSIKTKDLQVHFFDAKTQKS